MVSGSPERAGIGQDCPSSDGGRRAGADEGKRLEDHGGGPHDRLHGERRQDARQRWRITIIGGVVPAEIAASTWAVRAGNTTPWIQAPPADLDDGDGHGHVRHRAPLTAISAIREGMAGIDITRPSPHHDRISWRLAADSMRRRAERADREGHRNPRNGCARRRTRRNGSRRAGRCRTVSAEGRRRLPGDSAPDLRARRTGSAVPPGS